MTLHTVDIALDKAPELHLIGRGVHGEHRLQERYVLPEWQLHMYTYHSHYLLDGQRVEVKPGTISITPPGRSFHQFFPKRCAHLYAHFTLPGRDQWQQLPVAFDAGQHFSFLFKHMESAITLFARNAPRATIRFWDIIWQCCDQHYTQDGDHPALEKVSSYIALHMHENLQVQDLVAQSGISQAQLGRLCKQHHGCTIQVYLRQQRAQRAAQLLRHTQQGITDIAHQIGIHNLQQFNKLIRREFGQNPRSMRTH